MYYYFMLYATLSYVCANETKSQKGIPKESEKEKLMLVINETQKKEVSTLIPQPELRSIHIS